MAYSALVSLAQTLDMILNPTKYSISADEKEKIISIREYAIFLISFLEDFPEKAIRLEGKIRDLANEAEDIIEDFMWKAIQVGWWSVGLSRVEFEHQLESVREEIGSIAGELMDDRLGDSPAAVSSSRLASAGKNDVVIGLDEDLMAIKDRLYGVSSKLEVIPIVGMGGIGKTTLAKIAYDDSLIIGHFDIRAWVTISQHYNKQEIIVGILESIKLLDEQMLAPDDKNIIEGKNDKKKIQVPDNKDPMETKIYQILKGRRYLIVMDDVWSTKALDDVKHLFPDENNGSRVMLTTRLSDVAAYSVSGSLVHEMKFMDENKSWNLLKQKVFTKGNGQDCPLKLEGVGRKIARRCRGLPLALVLVAGVLCTVVENPASWYKIAENVNSVLDTKDGLLEKILSLSYTHLPHHLRSCFLYMGGFPKKHGVHASKLIKLWVAEGFLKHTNESKTLEEEAEEYLEDLVERNLVLVNSRKSTGKIKSFGLHDLVRDLCIRKAREEKFFLHDVDEFVDQRRFSITNFDHLNIIYGSTIRTIVCFKGSSSSSSSLDFLRSLGRVRLLRILDVVNDSDEELPSQIFELLHLRYLSLSSPVDVPSTISKLENLHTLIINPNAYLYSATLPLEIWRMPQLRHLVVSYLDVLPDPADESTLSLENLQTLSIVKGLVCSEEFLKMFPNVRKLGLVYDWYDDEKDNQLHNLTCLCQLEKLKLTIRKYSWMGRHPAFPRTLKKLTLVGGGFAWKDMILVGSLPNLEVLKLIDCAYDGDRWETTNGEFPRLKLLFIDKSHLRHWITESSHFPRLKCLILRRCLSLSQIPNSIAEIPSLELIQVDHLNKLLVDSAKQIQEDEQSNGNDALQVRIVNQEKTLDLAEVAAKAYDDAVLRLQGIQAKLNFPEILLP